MFDGCSIIPHGKHLIGILSLENIGIATPNKKNMKTKVKDKEFHKHYTRHFSHKITRSQGVTLYKSEGKLEIMKKFK